MRGWSTAHRDFELDLYWTHTPSVGGVGGVGVACDLSPAEHALSLGTMIGSEMGMYSRQQL